MVLPFVNIAPQGPLEFGRRLWLKILLIATFLFLYSPIAVLVAFSFNDSKRNITWQGFTLKYYGVAWNNPDLIEAFTNSLLIAFVSTIFSTIIGSMVGLQLWRFRFPGKTPFEAFMMLPIVIPEISLGVALMAYFFRLGWLTANVAWPINLSPIVIAHIAFSFPFVAVVVRSRMVGFNMQLEEASRDLGASQWQTFWFVLFPFMKPGVIAGALLAFTLSLDDFVITYFSSGPGSVTFPVKVYSLVRRGVTPDINAASSVLILITVVATVLAMKLQAPAKAAKG
jgi:spermidine/putrescine transport system permease protein